MHSCLITHSKPYRLSSVVVLTALLSGWTCTAIIHFDTCTDAVLQPHVSSLWPDTISADAVPILIVVSGTNFNAQSEILWNGNALQTTFINPNRLQTTITQPTLDLFGGSAGGTVLISVMSPTSSTVVSCSRGGLSGTLVLFIE